MYQLGASSANDLRRIASPYVGASVVRRRPRTCSAEAPGASHNGRRPVRRRATTDPSWSSVRALAERSDSRWPRSGAWPRAGRDRHHLRARRDGRARRRAIP
jgi:hypothetical protein